MSVLAPSSKLTRPSSAALMRVNAVPPSTAIGHRWTLLFVLGVVAAGCAREEWPTPPPVDSTTYHHEHEAFLAGERAYLSKVLPVTGIWPLGDGETSFGADTALPISLPFAHVAPLAGTFRRMGNTVTVRPAPDFVLRLKDGARLDGEAQVESVLAGPVQLDVTDVGDELFEPPPLRVRRTHKSKARRGLRDHRPLGETEFESI